MFKRMLTELIIWAILLGVAILLLLAIVNGWMPNNGGNAASITTLHDMQPRDKQSAMEIVIDQKAGKRWNEQATGAGSPEDERESEKGR